jgi:hypothetical protein
MALPTLLLSLQDTLERRRRERAVRGSLRDRSEGDARDLVMVLDALAEMRRHTVST